MFLVLYSVKMEADDLFQLSLQFGVFLDLQNSRIDHTTQWFVPFWDKLPEF